MAYYVTPDLGLELADPLTIQAFETVNVNSNFELVEAGIVADRVRLGLVEGRATTLETDVETLQDRVTARPADLAALAALATGELLSGDLAYVTALSAIFVWSGSAWVQVSTAKFADSATRDTEYAKAAAAYRVAGVVSRVTTEAFDRVYSPVAAWVPNGLQQLLVKPTGLAGGTESGGVVTVTAAATAVRLDGVFNAAYGFPKYRVTYEFVTSAAAAVNVRLALATVLQTPAYDNQRDTSIGNVDATVQAANAADFQATPFGIAAGVTRGTIIVERPHLTLATEFLSDYTVRDATFTAASGAGRTNGRHRTAAAYDGINFAPASGNFTSGTITVEGLSS